MIRELLVIFIFIVALGITGIITAVLVDAISPFNHERDFLPSVTMLVSTDHGLHYERNKTKLVPGHYPIYIKFEIYLKANLPFWMVKGQPVTIKVDCPTEFDLDDSGITWGASQESLENEKCGASQKSPENENKRKIFSVEVTPFSKNHKVDFVFCSKAMGKNPVYFYVSVGSHIHQGFVSKFTLRDP